LHRAAIGPVSSGRLVPDILSVVPSDFDKLREAFRLLTHEYIRALQDHELAGLDALPPASGDAVNSWIERTNIADEINGRRLAVREDLLEAMRRGS
jgi:hypothetical protein